MTERYNHSEGQVTKKFRALIFGWYYSWSEKRWRGWSNEYMDRLRGKFQGAVGTSALVIETDQKGFRGWLFNVVEFTILKCCIVYNLMSGECYTMALESVLLLTCGCKMHGKPAWNKCNDLVFWCTGFDPLWPYMYIFVPRNLHCAIRAGGGNGNWS